jgi:hypothetical protein
VERIIYDRYRVTVIGSVPIKMQLRNSQEVETRQIAFCLRGEIDKTTLHKTKPRKKFAENGRMFAIQQAKRITAIQNAEISPLERSSVIANS